MSTVSPPTAAPTNRQELVGEFDRIVWQAPEANEGPRYCILSVNVDDGERTTKQTAKGTVDPLDLIRGVRFRFYGKWGAAKGSYPAAFEFTQFIRQEPHSRGGMISYLQKYATGIGYVFAAKLWDHFGSDAAKTLRMNPDAIAAVLPKIPASTLKDASEALRALAKTEDTRIELATLFEGRQFSKNLPEILIKKWGIHAPRIVRNDPFKLLVNRIPSCGFARVDKLYADLGLPPDRLKRQFACIWRALLEDSNGHTWHPLKFAAETINASISGVSSERINWKRAVKLGQRAGWLRLHRDGMGDTAQWYVTERKKADAESRIVEAVAGLMKAKPKYEWPWPDSLNDATDHQCGIVSQMTSGMKPVCILAGTPGTGKTTLAAMIAKAVASKAGAEFVGVVAPTGKAAVRIQAAMERNGLQVNCGTIHRILGVTRNGHDGDGWGFVYRKGNPLPYDLIMIDEASMLDATTAADLFDAIAPGTLVLIVGDPYQLPPVGHGAPLRDLIVAGVPYGELTEVLRNDGAALRACRAIKDGVPPKPPERINLATGDNWAHFHAGTSAQIVAKLRNAIESLKGIELNGKVIDPTWDVQVIVALNEKGELNRKDISKLLQSILNQNGEQREGYPFRVGDKIICTSNCVLPIDEDQDCEGSPAVGGDASDESDSSDDVPGEFIANGELGRVTGLSKAGTHVRFESPERRVIIPRTGGEKSPSSNFDLGYAMTFHKTQGSQWPVVILLADRAADRMASRELWYTGISRFETLILTMGELGTIYRQCRRIALKDRRTFLAERLKERLE